MANKGAPTVCSPQVKGKMRRKHPGGGMHHRCTLAGLPASMAFRWRKSPCRPSLSQKNTASRGRMAQICGKSKKSEQTRAGAWGAGRERGARGARGRGGGGTPAKTRGVRGAGDADDVSGARGAGADDGSGGEAISRGPVPEERPDSRHRWRLGGFRCSPDAPGGRKTRFGAVLAGALAAKRVSVQSGPHRNRRTPSLPEYFVVKTTERPIKPRRFGARTAKTGNPNLDRPQSLHRNPSGCQAGRDCCTETRLPAIRPDETAPGLARLSVSSCTKLIRGRGTRGIQGHGGDCRNQGRGRGCRGRPSELTQS